MTTKSQNTRDKIAARKWALKFVAANGIKFKGKKNKILLKEINQYQKTNHINLLAMYLALKQPFTPAEIEKINNSKTKKKKQHQAYKHGDDFYKSDKWRSLRYKALSLNDGCCVLCGRSKAKHGVVLHVDHIKPRSKHPELELELSNLQILCEDCNLGKSNRDRTDWRKPVKRKITEANDRAYLHAFRKDYCSSGVKKFTEKEIQLFEDRIKQVIA